jgi:hypothetical protein
MRRVIVFIVLATLSASIPACSSSSSSADEPKQIGGKRHLPSPPPTKGNPNPETNP